MADPRLTLEEEIAELIAEEVGVGYQLNPDGTVNPDTIRVFAHGAAFAVIHRLRAPTGKQAP
jgi:hypothetical protein